jgi:group I intron endonuclease
MNTGVYMIEHTASGKKYVGSAAKSFSRRWHTHRSRLRNGTHHSRHLQAAWDKYGEEAFVFRIVEPCLPEHATGVEQVFIDWYKSTDREFGYNIAPVAGSCLGIKRTAETCAKLSVAKKGRKLTAEHCAKLSSALIGNSRARGNILSSETRERMSDSKTGQRHSDESYEKAASKNRGRKASVESRAKMSLGQLGNKNGLGRKHSDAVRAKIKAAWVERRKVPVSAETLAKMSAANRGRKHTAEACAKISAAQTSRYAAKKGATTCLARD